MTGKQFARLCWEFLRRDAKIAMSYRLQTFFQIASLFTIVITFFFFSLMLGRAERHIEPLAKYGGNYFAFAVVGVAVSMAVDSSLRIFSTSIRMAQIAGTFEAMLVTPAPIGAIVAGSGMYSLVNTIARSAVLLVLGGALFGMNLHLESWPATVLVVILTLGATLALGIFSAGFIVLFKQGDPITALISGLSWLLSGVLYPREVLPAGIQTLSDLLPLTHALEALRLQLLMGAGTQAIARPIFGLTLFCGFSLPLSLLWFAWAVRRARVLGSLARY